MLSFESKCNVDINKKVGKKLIVRLTKWINHDDDDDGLHWLLILSKVKHRYYSINTLWWHTYTQTHTHTHAILFDVEKKHNLRHCSPLPFVVVIVVAATNKHIYIRNRKNLLDVTIAYRSDYYASFFKALQPIFSNMILSYYH